MYHRKKRRRKSRLRKSHNGRALSGREKPVSKSIEAVCRLPDFFAMTPENRSIHRGFGAPLAGNLDIFLIRTFLNLSGQVKP